MNNVSSRQTGASAENGARNGNGSGKPATNGKVARGELALVQVYMDLTGRSESQARSVLMFFPEKNHAVENGAEAGDTLNGAHRIFRAEFEERKPQSSPETKEEEC